MAYGTEQIEGKWSYQALIIIQFAFVAALLIFFPWFPESPYWHLQNGRPEKARGSLERIHGRSDGQLIDAEMERIVEDIRSSEELAAKAGASGPVYLQLFKGKNLVSSIVSTDVLLQYRYTNSHD